MRIGLVAPPFIPVPPLNYGGTELFIAHLAEGLKELGHDVVVYANGESKVSVECRSIYPTSEWPIKGEVHGSLKDMNHSAWSVADAHTYCDLLHLNNAPGLVYSRFVSTPFVYTIHHPHEDSLSDFYQYYPDIHYVTISDFQRHREKMPHMSTIHHGLEFSKYRLTTNKQGYLAFIGRIAPVKGTHLAIEVAEKSGIPLKIAGEIQPMFRDYYESQVEPHVDGKFIQYIGEADLEEKNDLLGNASAMLFPIQWDEPFGLVMIEAMACGTPVIAMPGGSVPEIVKDGVSGWVCRGVEEMAERARHAADFDPAQVRAYAEQTFSLDRMVRQYADLYAGILAEMPAGKGITVPQRAIA
jgi:glycosyltransferase involved in cell wall biosynthesis